jgi:O-antigen/teichoic acid export membrane protein
VIDRALQSHPPAVASNMAMTALGNAVTPVAALVTLPILSYTLGVTGRGEIAAATAPLLLAVTAATFGIPEAVAYLVAKAPSALPGVARRGAWLILLSGVLATGVCVLASNLLAGGDPALGRLIVVASLAVVPTGGVLILRACAAGLQRWRLVAVEQALTALLRLGGTAGLALTGRLTPLSAVVVIAVTPVLGGLAYLPLRRHHRRPAVHPASAVPTSTRQIVGYGSRVWIGSLTGVMLARLDQTVMTPLAGTYQLGLYAVAASVGDAALILHSAVRDVTFTADAARRDDLRLCASARISGFLSLAVALILAAVIPVGLPLVFGPDFAPAIPVAFVMLAAVVVVTPGSIAGAGLSARGHPGLRSAALLVACVINVVVLVLLVPVLGAIGAALATLAGNLIASQLNIVFLIRRSAIPARQFYGLRRSDITIMAGKARELARFATRRVRTAKLR